MAAIVLMSGGIMWLTAGGSADKVATAKSLIGASLTGLVLTMTSYAILFQINPNLTDVGQGIKVVVTDPVVLGCCEIVDSNPVGRTTDKECSSRYEGTFHVNEYVFVKNDETQVCVSGKDMARELLQNTECASKGGKETSLVNRTTPDCIAECAPYEPNPVESFSYNDGSAYCCICEDHTSGTGSNDDRCDANDDCTSGVCFHNICQAGIENDPCEGFEGCKAPLLCVTDLGVCSNNCSRCGEGAGNECDSAECFELRCTFSGGTCR